MPSALNGMWWGLGGNREATIAVTNTAGNSAVADVFLDFHGKRRPAAPLYFDPHETKVLSIRDLLEQISEHPATTPEGGISIIPRGTLPTLIAQGMMIDPTTGFSTTLNFPSPDSQRASALHASGVPFGKPSNDSPFAGAGTFIPHAVVRNLTASVENITVTIEYPSPQGPRQVALAPFSLDGFSTKDVALDSFFNLLPSPLPFCSIRIQYDGPAGSVLAEVSSVEQKGDLVVDSRVANEGDSWASSGANPWHLDAETESVLFLTNMGESVSRVGVQVQADGIPYHLTKLKLQPHETRAIDLRQLRDAQMADFRGNKIPSTATDGSILWIRQDAVPLMGRLLVLNRQKGVAGNFNCTVCPCPPDFTGVTVDPFIGVIIVGDTMSFFATETQTDCNNTNFFSDITGSSTWSSANTAVATVDATQKGLVLAVGPGSAGITATHSDLVYTDAGGSTCLFSRKLTDSGSATCNVRPNVTISGPNALPLGTDVRSIDLTASGNPPGGTYSWSSSSTKIGLQNPASSTATIVSVVQSDQPNDIAVTVAYTMNGQTKNASTNLTVQKPSSLSIVPGTSSTTSESSCTFGDPPLAGCGVTRTFVYQVNDQFTHPILFAGMQFWDSITNTGTNTCNLSGFRTTCTGFGKPNGGPCGPTTDAGGQFNEELSICASACRLANGGCTTGCNTIANQTWQINGITLPTLNPSYQCNQVLVNGN